MPIGDHQSYTQSVIEEKQQTKAPKIPKNSLFFVFIAILWEIAAILIFGYFIGYDSKIITVNGFNFFLNIYVIVALFIFIVVGFTLMSSYVTSSSSINMTFSFFLAVFTLQNWFIYRLLWYKIGLARDPLAPSFKQGPAFNQISYLPVGNIRGVTDDYLVSSFYDAIGTCIAMFCALTPILGRIGFTELFFLGWLGPFMYEINSAIFNRFFIVDNGFGMRGFLFGGLLGFFISLCLGKKAETLQHDRFKSHYHIQSLTFIGAIIVCLTYPNVISAGLLTGTDVGTVPGVAGIAQINSWLSLAGSIVGTYAACSIMYAHLNVHDIAFTALSGAIAFSSSTTLNYNPGAAIAVGSGVGFLCALIHTPLKRWVNTDGVRQSNSVLVQFIIPGTIACIISSILQAIGDSSISSGDFANTRNQSRSSSGQAGWQLMGFAFSLGSAIICGVIVGLIMRCAADNRKQIYFNDNRFIIAQTKQSVEERERTVARSNVE